MSFFSGDVVAKEQLPGAVGSAAEAPPVIPPPSLKRGGILHKRKTPLLLSITPQGDILVTIPLKIESSQN